MNMLGRYRHEAILGACVASFPASPKEGESLGTRLVLVYIIRVNLEQKRASLLLYFHSLAHIHC